MPTATKPAPTDAAPPLIAVSLLDAADLVHPTEGRLLRRGDVVELPADRALALIRSDKAAGLARVKTIEPHVQIGNRIMAAGETGWMPQGRAERLEARGSIKILADAPGSRPSSL